VLLRRRRAGRWDGVGNGELARPGGPPDLSNLREDAQRDFLRGLGREVEAGGTLDASLGRGVNSGGAETRKDGCRAATARDESKGSDAGYRQLRRSRL